MFLITKLAALVPQAPAGGMTDLLNGPLPQMLPFVLMFGVLYFLLFRPMNKQRREHQTMLTALTKGDEVATSGGVYGRIVAIDEREATLEIADKVKIRILRDRIAGRWNPTAAVAGSSGSAKATPVAAQK